MEKNMYNEIIQNNLMALKADEEISNLSLLKTQKIAMSVLFKTDKNLKLLSKLEKKISEKNLVTQKFKKSFSTRLEEIISVKGKDNHAIQLLLLECQALKQSLKEQTDEKDILQNECSVKEEKYINKYRQSLIACKLLTNTYLDIQNSISGYTIDKDLNYKSFEIKPQQVNSKEITEYLWKNMMYVS